MGTSFSCTQPTIDFNTLDHLESNIRSLRDELSYIKSKLPVDTAPTCEVISTSEKPE